jgi:prepilin-type N-terminal cleavage/methylation domain-containing protein
MNRTRPSSLDATRSGFSLMELMLVVTLLAIITSAVVPVYSGSLGSIHANHAVRDIVALIKYAQERAVSDTTEYRLYLDDKNGQYWLMRWEESEDGFAFVEADERGEERRTLPPDLSMKEPDAFMDKDRDVRYIGFYPSGACDFAELQLVKDNGDVVTVGTKCKLGQIEVDE